MKKPIPPIKPTKILAKRQYLDGKTFNSYDEIPYEDFLKKIASLTKDQDPQKCLIEINSEYSEDNGCWTEIDCYSLINDPEEDYNLKLAQYEKDYTKYEKDLKKYEFFSLEKELDACEKKIKKIKKQLELKK